MRNILIAIAVLLVGLAVTRNMQSTLSKWQLPKIPAISSILSPQRPKTATPPAQFATDAKPPVLQGSEEEQRVQMLESVLPSVVTIGINFTTREQDRIQLNPFDPFEFFNGQGGGAPTFRRVPGRERTIERNIGSGFIVTATGLIITNKHVVDQTDAKYKVRLNDGKTLDVEQIYRDPLNDLAILKVTPSSPLPALALGDSSKLKLGQSTIAVGTPLGEFTNSVTTGIVSGLGRGITAGSPLQGSEKLDDVIQTDAAISPGNSGGPLLSSRGEVIGVNVAVSGEGENIGFAIPVNVVKTLLTEFERRGGSFERPYMGVQYQMIDKRIALANDLVEGAYVQEVVAGSPADRAGIQPDDVITAIDGTRVTAADDQSIVKILLDRKVGETISVTYWRVGEEKTVQLTLEAYKQ